MLYRTASPGKLKGMGIASPTQPCEQSSGEKYRRCRLSRAWGLRQFWAGARVTCATFTRGGHVPERSEGRGLRPCHAVGSSGRATQTAPKGCGSPSPGQRPGEPCRDTNAIGPTGQGFSPRSQPQATQIVYQRKRLARWAEKKFSALAYDAPGLHPGLGEPRAFGPTVYGVSRKKTGIRTALVVCCIVAGSHFVAAQDGSQATQAGPRAPDASAAAGRALVKPVESGSASRPALSAAAKSSKTPSLAAPPCPRFRRRRQPGCRRRPVRRCIT